MVQPLRGFHFGVDSIVLAHAIRAVDVVRVAELGAGSGIISFILASHGIGREFWLFERDSVMLECLEMGISLNGIGDIFKVIPGDLRDFDPVDFPKMDLVVFNPPYYPFGRGHGRVGDPASFLTFAAGLVSSKGLIAYVMAVGGLRQLTDIEQHLGLKPVAFYDVINQKGNAFCQVRILSRGFVGVPFSGSLMVDNLEECGAWWVGESCMS